MAAGEGTAMQLIFSTKNQAGASDSQNWKENKLSRFIP